MVQLAPTFATGAAPAVTIVIPAYNYSRYIGSAITSALKQTFAAIEVLIIDDGSTDATAEVVKPFVADKRVRYHYKVNAGLSAARNTGIELAQAPLVVFLDADDELEAEFIARGVETLNSLPDEFGLFACRYRAIDARGNLLPMGVHEVRGSREISRDDLILKNRFAPVVMVRRQLLRDLGGFDVTLKSSEDREMWIRVAAAARIYFRDELLVRKRAHATNMSRHSDRMRAAMRTVILRAYRQERYAWWRFPLWLQVAAYFHLQNAWMLHDEGRQREAIRDAVVSLLLWPGFMRPSKLDEPILFRVRSLARFLLRPNQPTPVV